MSNTTPTLGSALFPDDGSEVVEAEVAKWMRQQVALEVRRIKESGANALPVPVKNTSLVIDGDRIVNRLEVDTGFDFDRVKQIMLSEPIACPVKAGYNYVNVLCFTEQPLPLILAYLYTTERSNPLTDWLFVNSKFEKSQHRIDSFSQC